MNPTIENLNDPKWWADSAPEGATHYDPSDDRSPWMRANALGRWEYYDGSEEWIKLTADALSNCRIDPREFIPRPHHSVDATDMVNQPPHYQSDDGIECIDAIRAQLTEEEFRGYCKGNVAKYVWRERHKGGTESLRKAEWYLGQITKT